MSTALVTVNDTPTDLATMSGLGLEDVKLKPTTVELVQRSTKRQDAQPGKLFDTLTETNYDSLQVVPLLIRNTRVLFPEDGGLGADPLCRSNDGIVPSANVQFKMADYCNKCPKSSWSSYDRKTGKGKPPCQAKKELLMILKDGCVPRRMSFGRTSLKPFETLLSRIKEDLQKAISKGEKGVNLFDYTFTISTTFVEGKYGSYYIAKFSDVKRVATNSEFGPYYVEYVQQARAKEDPDVIEADDAIEVAVEEAAPAI